jgi:hypothetical protein
LTILPSYFILLWSFIEWVNDPYFYRKLREWEAREEKLFSEYKFKMDLEFPDNNVKDSASIGDRDWLMCPKCIDAWYWPSDQDAQVVCPNCNNIYKNPCYMHPFLVE